MSPKTVSPGGTVTFQAHLTDIGGSGVATSNVIIYFLPNNAGQGSYNYLTLVSGTAQDGIWQAVIQIPPAAPAGFWAPAPFAAGDIVGNRAVAPASMVTDTSFTVVRP